MSVDFDPVKVGSRQRRVEPLAIGVLAVLIAMAVAVVKPWQSGAVNAPAGDLPAGAAQPDGSAAPVTTAGAQTAVARVARTPTWSDLEPAIKSHDAWGVRVIFLARRGLKPDPRVRYMEGWWSAAPTPNGLETTSIERDDRAIVALGITHPPGSAPQDVQIWRVDADDELQWIDARPIDRTQADGAFLFLRFGVAESGYQVWDAGRYRIGMLRGDGVRWVVIEIPERLASIRPPDARPATEALVVGQQASDPRAVRVGLFASVNGGGPPVAARDGPLLDEPTAWVDELRGPTASSPRMVARAYLSRPSWLGVMLTPRASVRWATIRPLAPEPGFDAVPVSGGISRFHGQTPFVVFGAPRGGAWAAGVYAISVAWVDGTGPRIGTWHVELGRTPIQPAFVIRP